MVTVLRGKNQTRQFRWTSFRDQQSPCHEQSHDNRHVQTNQNVCKTRRDSEISSKAQFCSFSKRRFRGLLLPTRLLQRNVITECKIYIFETPKVTEHVVVHRSDKISDERSRRVIPLVALLILIRDSPFSFGKFVSCLLRVYAVEFQLGM